MAAAKKTTKKTIKKADSKAKNAEVVTAEKSVKSELNIGAIKSQMNLSALTANRRKIVFIIIALLIVLILGFVAYKNLVLAWVDNLPVSRTEYLNTLEQRYGKDVKDELVSIALVNSEAKKRGIAISKDEIEAKLKETKDQAGGEDQFNQQLQAQNATIDEVKKTIRLRLLVDKMFSTDATVSAQEVDQFIQSNSDRYKTSDDATKKEVADILKSQKTGSAFYKWLNEAKSSSRVRGLD